VDVQKGTFTIEFNAAVPGLTSVTLAPGTTLRLDANGLANALGTAVININGGTITKTAGSGVNYTTSAINVNEDFTHAGSANGGFLGPITFSKDVTINATQTSTFFRWFGSLNESG